jgi:hypothetical protein
MGGARFAWRRMSAGRIPLALVVLLLSLALIAACGGGGGSKEGAAKPAVWGSGSWDSVLWP